MEYNEFAMKKNRIGLEDIENLDRLNLETGVIRELSPVGELGISSYYLSLAGICFQISEESFKQIVNRIARIKNTEDTMENTDKKEEVLNNKEELEFIYARMEQIEATLRGIKRDLYKK